MLGVWDVVAVVAAVVVVVVGFFLLHWLVRVLKRLGRVEFGRDGEKTVSGVYVAAQVVVGFLVFWVADKFIHWRMPGENPDVFVVGLVGVVFAQVAFWAIGELSGKVKRDE